MEKNDGSEQGANKGESQTIGGQDVGSLDTVLGTTATSPIVFANTETVGTLQMSEPEVVYGSNAIDQSEGHAALTRLEEKLASLGSYVIAETASLVSALRNHL